MRAGRDVGVPLRQWRNVTGPTLLVVLLGGIVCLLPGATLSAQGMRPPPSGTLEAPFDLRDDVVVADGRRLFLLADGRLVNLAAAEGHPAQVMDMSFANQALSAEYVVQNATSLEKKVYVVPEEIDNEIARLKLATMGVEIDRLTEEQAKYLASWDEGT